MRAAALLLALLLASSAMGGRRFVAEEGAVREVRMPADSGAGADLRADPSALFLPQSRQRALDAAAQRGGALAPGLQENRLAVLDRRSLFEISSTGALFERYFSGSKSTPVPHASPSGAPLVSVVAVSSQGPGRTIYHGVVVLDAEGRVFQRMPSGPPWVDISPPNAQLRPGGVCTADGAALFVSAEGDVLRRDFAEDRWDQWTRPSSGRVAVVVDLGSLLPNVGFAIFEHGSLMQYSDGNWVDLGRPVDAPLSLLPGVVIRDLNAVGSMFFVAGGSLVEYWWNSAVHGWQWISHGHPEDRRVVGAPGALIGSRSLFMAVEGGLLYERGWDGYQWVWTSHRAPSSSPVAAVRPVAIDAHVDQPIILSLLQNEKLAARQFRKVKDRFVWKVYGALD